jgi:hypothetical protein
VNYDRGRASSVFFFVLFRSGSLERWQFLRIHTDVVLAGSGGLDEAVEKVYLISYSSDVHCSAIGPTIGSRFLSSISAEQYA